jgi:histidine triad (HIT) family protein
MTSTRRSRKAESAMRSTYDTSNIFAKILRGEAPCVKLYEDAHSLAFMDIMPRTPGHALVVPKSPARNILDIEPGALAAMMPSVQKLAIAIKAAMVCDGISIQQFNETAAGQVVFHLHFHILPRWDGIALKPPGGPIEKSEVLSAHARAITKALGV